MSQIPRLQHRLKTAILVMDLRPGTFMTHRQLTDFFGETLPLPPVTLRQLESSGLLVCREDGCLIAPLDVDEIRTLCAERITIEYEAVRLATRRATGADCTAIEALARRGAHDQNDPDQSVKSGGEFHATLAELSGNPLIIKMQASLSERLFRVRWLIFSSPAGRRLGWEEHRQIAALMTDGHPDQAANQMRKHLSRTHDQLLDTLLALNA